MNLMLFALIVVIVAYILTEPGTYSFLALAKDNIKKFFHKEDATSDFLAGIDNIPLSHDEILEFRNFLTSPKDTPV